MTEIYISFNNNENNYIYDSNNINSYYFYKLYESQDIYLITADQFYIQNKIIFDKLLEFNLVPIYKNLYDEFISNDYNENINFNKIIYIFLLIFSIFNKNKRIINKHELNQFSCNDIMDNKLIIRPGVVELNVVNEILYGDKNIMLKVIEKIKLNYNDEKFFYNVPGSKFWIGTSHTFNDYYYHLTRLITNAGFYFNCNDSIDQIYNSLYKFSIEYRECIYNSDYIGYWPFLNCYMLDILNEKKQINKINHCCLPSGVGAINYFNNKTILFLTPFKKQIDKIYESNNIYNIYKNPEHNFKNIKLITLEAYVTTYPNNIHNNFDETMQYYKDEIDYIFINNKIDIFTCTVGCYGLELCNYVYKKYNITSVYYGNLMNSVFGVLMNRNLSHSAYINIEYCEYSDLNERYKNIDKIENNCYGYINKS
jgi:hypothetical protein